MCQELRQGRQSVRCQGYRAECSRLKPVYQVLVRVVVLVPAKAWSNVKGQSSKFQQEHKMRRNYDWSVTSPKKYCYPVNFKLIRGCKKKCCSCCGLLGLLFGGLVYEAVWVIGYISRPNKRVEGLTSHPLLCFSTTTATSSTRNTAWS